MVKAGLEVGICGTSPHWTGIEESLQQRRQLRVRRLGNSLTEAAREIRMLSPDVILFEISQPETTVIAGILRKFPGTKLIGLNPKDQTFIVFSASERPILAADELAGAIMGNEADGI